MGWYHYTQKESIDQFIRISNIHKKLDSDWKLRFMNDHSSINSDLIPELLRKFNELEEKYNEIQEHLLKFKDEE